MKRLLVILLVLLLCASAAVADTDVAYIDGLTADRVHLRSAPSVDADSLGLYFTGTDVIIIEQMADWTRVMVGDETGCIMTKYLTEEQPARLGSWAVVDNPHSTWVNLRMSPSMEGLIAVRPDNGTLVQVLGETADGWSYVDCGGVKGYIVTSMLGEAAENRPANTVVLGWTAEGEYIHQYAAPNGQKICFTACENPVYIIFQDVNFDGIDDIVVHAAAGASNFFSEFFVYSSAAHEYVRVMNNSGEERLCNYQLYPEYGLVGTQSNNGSAGLLHVWNLYRWEGNELRLIRSAVSDEWSESIVEGQTYTSIIHGDTLHVTVSDYTGGDDASVLWEIIIPKEEAEYRDIFNEEMEVLWQGL